MKLRSCGMKPECYKFCPAFGNLRQFEDDAAAAARQIDAIQILGLPSAVENELIDRLVEPLEVVGNLALGSALAEGEGGPWRAHYVNIETGERVDGDQADRLVCCQTSISRIINIDPRSSAPNLIAIRGGVYQPQTPAA